MWKLAEMRAINLAMEHSEANNNVTNNGHNQETFEKSNFI